MLAAFPPGSFMTDTVGRSPRSASGFTLIELQVAMALLVVLAGSSLMFTSGVLPAMRSDTQARRLVALLNYAREMANSSRRDIEVRFNLGQSTVQLIRRDAGREIPMETFVFEHGVQLRQFPGLGDTPEAYGAKSAVDFGNATTLLFDSEGGLIDETGLPANGTIFVGLPDTLQSARAISVTGTTGRPRLYRWHTDGAGGGSWAR
jgi:prepilin-type N-terminal cleavage/methylation domain-containing protein